MNLVNNWMYYATYRESLRSIIGLSCEIFDANVLGKKWENLLFSSVNLEFEKIFWILFWINTRDSFLTGLMSRNFLPMSRTDRNDSQNYLQKRMIFERNLFINEIMWFMINVLIVIFSHLISLNFGSLSY